MLLGSFFCIFENDDSHRRNNNSTGNIENTNPNPIRYPIRIIIPIGDCISYNMSVNIYVVYFLNLNIFICKQNQNRVNVICTQQHSWSEKKMTRRLDSWNTMALEYTWFTVTLICIAYGKYMYLNAFFGFYMRKCIVLLYSAWKLVIMTSPLQSQNARMLFYHKNVSLNYVKYWKKAEKKF